MPKNGQRTGEADFKVSVFQEYFGTKKFTYRQETDRIDFILLKKNQHIEPRGQAYTKKTRNKRGSK